MNLLKYGPNRTFVKGALWLSWPVIRLGKKWSSLPVLKWIIAPFFMYPYNETTSIPIHVEIDPPETVSLPQRLVRRVIACASDIFILDECMCRRHEGCRSYDRHIGCMAMGRAVERMHPSHGRRVGLDEAHEHVRKASEAGLVASVAHVWIDPLAFGLTRFDRLMFICFCDDCCCLYRTHMTKRGPTLDRACKGLPGVTMVVDDELCEGCAVCAGQCFVGAIAMDRGHARIGDDCRGCGRCVERCPRGAVRIECEDEELLFRRLMERIENVADIGAAENP